MKELFKKTKISSYLGLIIFLSFLNPILGLAKDYKTRLNLDNFAFNTYCHMKKEIDLNSLKTQIQDLENSNDEFDKAMALSFNISESKFWNDIAGKIIPFSAMAFQEIAIAHFGKKNPEIDSPNLFYAYLLFTKHEEERMILSYPEMKADFEIENYVEDKSFSKKINEYTESNEYKEILKDRLSAESELPFDVMAFNNGMKYASKILNWLLTQEKNSVTYDELIAKSMSLVNDPLLALTSIAFLFWQDVAEIGSRKQTSVLASKVRPLLDDSATDIHGITYHFWGYLLRTILGYNSYFLYSASYFHEGVHKDDWQDHTADRLGILAGRKILSLYTSETNCP